MAQLKTSEAKLSLQNLTFPEIETAISECPVMILPIGGIEPLGANAALGAVSSVSDALAAQLSARCSVLVAPILSFGCSVPLWSFGGTAGIKPRTLTNLTGELCKGWALQGFRSAVVINCLAENDDALCEAQRRAAGWKRPVRIEIFSIQSDTRTRAFIDKRIDGNESGRMEFGLLSMAYYLNPELFRSSSMPHTALLPDNTQYRTWQKRGKDPRKFRKLYPDALTSVAARNPDPGLGEELFLFTLDLLEETLNSLRNVTLKA